MGRFFARLAAVGLSLAWAGPGQAQVLFFPKGDADAAQVRALEHPWPYPPGVYRISPVYNEHCLGVEWANWPVAPFVMQLPCGSAPDIVLMPAPEFATGGAYYTLRAAGMTDARGRYSHCATIARGVAVGLPRIDMLPCEVIPGQRGWGAAGAMDQRFIVAPRNGVSRVLEANVVGIEASAKCWTMRGSSREILGDVVHDACRARAQNSQFTLAYAGPITAPAEIELLALAGWHPGPPGEPLRRASPVQGIDLPGGDYASEATANDYGRACAARCAADGRCRAFTWAPRRSHPDVHGDAAVCWLKDGSGGAPTRTPGVYSGYVIAYWGAWLQARL